MVYLQQQLANGQIVLVPQQPQSQQTVVVIKKPEPGDHGASHVGNIIGGEGGNEYQIVNPSAPSDNGPGDDDAPPMYANVAPPSYNDYMDDNEGGGNIGADQPS